MAAEKRNMSTSSDSIKDKSKVSSQFLLPAGEDAEDAGNGPTIIIGDDAVALLLF
jgi:hypothetical protein